MTMAADRIAWVRVSSIVLPLATPISDAKVLTGRQKPMTEVVMLFAEVQTADGHQGLGFSYSKRAGGPGQFAHAKEVAPVLIGEDPSDIGRLWNKLCWAGASVGRSGLATQALGAFDVALYDLKARRAEPVAGQAAGQLARFGRLLQHLGRLPAHAAGATAGQCRGFARAWHRRHQAEGGAARPRAGHPPRRGGAQAPGR